MKNVNYFMFVINNLLTIKGIKSISSAQEVLNADSANSAWQDKTFYQTLPMVFRFYEYYACANCRRSCPKLLRYYKLFNT